MSEIQAAQNINYLSYCTNSLGIVAWTADLAILLMKTSKMYRQMFMCVLMIIFHVSVIVEEQTNSLYVRSVYNSEPDWFKYKRNFSLNCTSFFLSYSCFMVSHWTFAFDYWKLSYKNKLKYDKRPVETN